MSKKDCFYLLAIVMLIEYLVFNWTHQFGADKNLTDHVSFAGTIVGIILAVVAIIYSFIQAESQSRSSNEIASQITSLRDVVSEIDISKKQFAGELNRIEIIAEKLDLVGSNVNETHKEVSNVGAELKQLTRQFSERKERETTEQAPLTPPSSFNKETALRLISTSSDSYTLAYCLKLAAGKNIPENDLLLEYYAVPLAELKFNLKDNPIEWRREVDLWLWPALQIMRFFIEFGLIELEAEKELVIVKEPFLEAVNGIPFDSMKGSMRVDIDAVARAFKKS